MKVTTLSVCLIIKNEKMHLRRCLASIKPIASEIIVVDTGSTDESKWITSQYGAQIFSYQWKNDFSSARNFGLDKASSDWIMVIDGDEELDMNCSEFIKEIIQNSDIEACLLTISQTLRKQHEFLDSPLQLRLFRNNKNYRYRGNIHEQILDSILEHNPTAQIKTASNIIIHHGCNQDDTAEEHRLKRNIELINEILPKEEDKELKSFYLGQEYYRHYRFIEALEHFRLAYAGWATGYAYTPEIRRYIIICLYQLGRSSEALAFVDDVLSVQEDSADLYFLKGIINKELGFYSEAYLALQEALTRFPQPPYHNIIHYYSKYMSLYLLGGLAEYMMDLEGALFYYFESLKNNPHMIRSLRRMIAILQPCKNPEYTVDSLNRVFDLSAPHLQAEIANIFYNEGAYQLALDCINQLESYGIKLEKISLLKGLCLLRVKKYSQVEEVLQNITQDRDLYIEARQYLVFYYWMIKNYPLVYAYLEQVKSAGADPARVYVLNLLTRDYASKVNIDQEEAYKLAKEFMNLLVELGNSSQVEVAFKNFAPLLGERPSILLAELYYNYEKYDLAKSEFLFLLEKGHEYPQIFYYLGKTNWALGNLDVAQQNFEQALNKGLDTPKIRREKGRLIQELSLQALKEKLSHSPEQSEVIKQIQELEKNLIEI